MPADVEALVTRNYGETAREKVATLKEHLGLAVIAVGIVVAVFMGWRSAVVVMLAVPITFALTLFVYQIFGYTLNRVTSVRAHLRHRDRDRRLDHRGREHGAALPHEGPSL